MGRCWICGKMDNAGSITPGSLVLTDLEICKDCWLAGARDLTVKQYLDIVRFREVLNRDKNLN